MHRAGSDPEKMEAADFLCDFCHRHWAEELRMIEGHHGSLICTECLSEAYRRVSLAGADDSEPGWTCTMCLESRQDPFWRSRAFPEARICRRCIKQAATVLEKDRDSGWTRPAAPPGA